LIFGKNKFESNTADVGLRIKAKQSKQYVRNLQIYQFGQHENQAFAPFSFDKNDMNIAIAEGCSRLHIRVKDAYMLNDCLVAVKRKTKMTFKETFNNLMTLSFFLNYSIHDKGVFYRKTFAHPKMKYIRVLAFMGLSPIRVDSLEACLRIKDRLRDNCQVKYKMETLLAQLE